MTNKPLAPEIELLNQIYAENAIRAQRVGVGGEESEERGEGAGGKKWRRRASSDVVRAQIAERAVAGVRHGVIAQELEITPRQVERQLQQPQTRAYMALFAEAAVEDLGALYRGCITALREDLEQDKDRWLRQGAIDKSLRLIELADKYRVPGGAPGISGDTSGDCTLEELLVAFRRRSSGPPEEDVR